MKTPRSFRVSLALPAIFLLLTLAPPIRAAEKPVGRPLSSEQKSSGILPVKRTVATPELKGIEFPATADASALGLYVKQLLSYNPWRNNKVDEAGDKERRDLLLDIAENNFDIILSEITKGSASGDTRTQSAVVAVVAKYASDVRKQDILRAFEHYHALAAVIAEKNWMRDAGPFIARAIQNYTMLNGYGSDEIGFIAFCFQSEEEPVWTQLEHLFGNPSFGVGHSVYSRAAEKLSSETKKHQEGRLERVVQAMWDAVDKSNASRNSYSSYRIIYTAAEAARIGRLDALEVLGNFLATGTPQVKDEHKASMQKVAAIPVSALTDCPAGLSYEEMGQWLTGRILSLQWNSQKKRFITGTERQQADSEGVASKKVVPAPSNDPGLAATKSYEETSLADIVKGAALLSSEKIDGSDGNEILPGSWFIYKTSEGNLGKLKVDRLQGTSLVLSWVTFDRNGSAHSSGSNLVVGTSWTFDLDSGSVPGPKGQSDFWWEGVTKSTRLLVPNNRAQCALILREKGTGIQSATNAPSGSQSTGLSASQPAARGIGDAKDDKPIDIKFTAVDGREVDLVKLRGKVVLIDFWATWCGPCMAEVPHVVEAYRKLHDKGFEIVGISFDQDRAAVERITKQKGMTWPQYFDGKGWQNAYGLKYGIHGIPTMWLIDKQGRIATTNARQDLAGQVEKLLAGGSDARPSTSVASDSLPWESDYAAALVKAKAEKRPLFLMLTATWCGPCKMLESQTLPDPTVRSGLKEFVWVKAYEDKELNAKFGSSGYPTLVFIDAEKERALAKTVGYQAPGPFLKPIIEARTTAGLSLTPEMQKSAAASFEPDRRKMEELGKAGDAAGLLAYLAPAAKDDLRKSNYIVVRVRRPAGLSLTDLVCTAAGGDVILPESGVGLITVRRTLKQAEVRIVAPGYLAIQDQVPSSDTAPVLSREYTLVPLPSKDAASFSGRVLLPDGQPAVQAIVRICDWAAVTRTGKDGRFEIGHVSPGKFLVRAERPGGEFQAELTFAAGAELKQDLRLQAATTVGLRWALQTQEGVRSLSGKGVQTGEAYFSVRHSRFLLERGAEVRTSWGSDLMLKDWNESLRQYAKPEALAELEKAPAGTPIFWLFDATSRRTGLHRETARFEDILEVNDGKPFDERSYFEFLRGQPVTVGAVYTLRCVRRDCYAKVEVLEVTAPPNAR